APGLQHAAAVRRRHFGDRAPARAVPGPAHRIAPRRRSHPGLRPRTLRAGGYPLALHDLPARPLTRRTHVGAAPASPAPAAAPALPTFLLCRRLGRRPGAALIAGLVYAHHGAMAIKVYFPNHLAPSAWIPLAFLLADRVLERRSPIACGLLAAVIGAAMLGGSPQFVYFTGLALVPFVVVRVLPVLRRDG